MRRTVGALCLVVAVVVHLAGPVEAADPAPLPLAPMAAAFDGYIAATDTALRAANPGNKLPFVGDEGIDQDTNLVVDVVSKLRSALAINLDARSRTPAELARILAGTPGPFGMTLIPDIRCGAAQCGPASLGKDVTRVLVTMDAGQGSPAGAPNCGGGACPGPISVVGRSFDVGLPGLKLSSEDTSTKGSVSWHLRVTVGVDPGGAFVATGNSPEFRVGLTLQLPTQLDATLGVVAVNAKVDGPIEGRGGFRGTIALDAAAPGGEARAGQGLSTSVALTAAADAVFHVEAGAGSALPGIGADLRLHWGWAAPETPASIADLSVRLDNVYVKPQDFLGKALKPIVDGLHDAVAPIAPVAEVLNEPLPGISDVFGDTSLIDLARIGASASENTSLQGLQQLIAIATKLTLVVGAVDNGRIVLGGVVFDNGDLLSTSGGPVKAAGAVRRIVDACGVCGQVVEDAQRLIDGGPRITFDVIDTPASLIGVLLGNDVPLVTFDSGTVKVQNTFGDDLPGGSFAGFGVGFDQALIDLDAHVRLGYDTNGMKRAVAGGGVATIADGLWVDGGSRIALHAPMALKITANFGVVGVKVIGGLTASASARVRGGQVGQKVRPAAGRLACAFVLGGGISASFAIEIDLPYPIPDIPIPIASTTLVDFDVLDAKNCAAPNVAPVLTHIAGTDLVLNAGDHRELRGDAFKGKETDAEVSRVTAERRQPNGTQVIRVDMQGYTQFVSSTPARPITGIVLEAGTHRGTETLVTTTDDGRPFDLNVFMRGADGGNTLTARTDPAHRVGFFGSPGPDRVTTGEANDTVSGVGGDDVFRLGKGNDVAFGGAGNDFIDGGPGRDELDGGAGDDQLIAGTDASPNLLVGDRGHDVLAGGPGPDRLFGDECNTAFESPCAEGYGQAPDAPALPGGGVDLIMGGGGADVMVAGGGDDQMFSGSTSAVVGGAAAQRVTAYGAADADLFVGGPGPDTFYGGPGDDRALGGGDADLLLGGAGNDILGGGIATNPPIDKKGLTPPPLGPAVQVDVLRGGPGNDSLTGGSGNDVVEGGQDGDVLDGGDGDDLIIGGSQAPGTPDAGDIAEGGAGNDIMIGDNGDRVAGGPRLFDVAGAVIGIADDLSGGAGSDIVLGGPGDDRLSGGDGDDRIEGGAGSDAVVGGDGQDDIVGGSSPSFLSGVTTASVDDAGDRMLNGGPGHDVILGDNGTMVRGEVVGDDPEAPDRIARTVRFLDSGPVGPVVGGGDRIVGGDGHDVAYGQAGDDTIDGDGGNDHLEGNQGADTIRGGAGQDDIAGGSTPAGLPLGTSTAQFADGGDVLLAGGEGHDVIVGDNGTITRGPVVADDPDAPDRVSRVVRLLDMGPTGTVVGGGDRIDGGDGHDLLWGQMGDDVIAGAGGNDTIEGNQGSDVLDGGGGQDDVIGGTTPAALPPGLTTGQLPDVGDTLAGGEGSDLLVGDNAVVSHPVDGEGRWARSTADGRYLRVLTLADRTTVGGPDVILGGDGNDDAFGGLGDDRMHGGTGQDYLEGNQGADVIDGSSGDDDIVGGTSPIGVGGSEKAAGSTPDGADTIHGRASDEQGQIPASGVAIGVEVILDSNGVSVTVSVRYGPIPEPVPGTEGDGDVIAGDNARIDRCAPRGLLVREWSGRSACIWTTRSIAFYGPTTARWVQQLGQPLFGLGVLNELIPDDHSGNDVVYGDDGDDLLLGEGGFDTMHGGLGDDILYGGLGLFNKLYGDGGGVDVIITPPDLSLLTMVGVS